MSKTTTKTIAVKLKPAAERMVKKGHPWVYEGSIVKQSAAANPQDLAIIFDQKKNKFLAIGFFAPSSPIRIKILQVHQSATIDTFWFAQKIETAFAKRFALLQTDTNAYRLIHGENDGLPALICDVYQDVLVIKLYAHFWLSRLDEWLPPLLQVSKAKTAVLRLSRQLQQQGESLAFRDGQILHGSLPNETITFREHGLLFSANVLKGHKTGYFLDHRHNRKRIAELSAGKKVLDVFAYAGGFSVHALAGGASEVISIDISKQALQQAKQNAELNQVADKLQVMVVDAFKAMEQLIAEGRLFDIVVIDPPSFAKQAAEVAVAKKQYQRLATLGAALVKKQGILFLASCSARVSADDFYAWTAQSLEMAGIAYEVMEKTLQDIDHPIAFREGAYLKAVYYRILV